MSDKPTLSERVLEGPVSRILERREAEVSEPKRTGRHPAVTGATYGANIGLGALLGGSTGAALGGLGGGGYEAYRMSRGQKVPKGFWEARRRLKEAPSSKQVLDRIRRGAKRGAIGGGSGMGLLGALMGAQIAYALTKQSASAPAPRSHLTRKSSNIKGYTYDAAGKSMYVTFKNGSTYRYDDVDPATYRSFRRSKSTGKALNRRLKATGKPFEQVSAPKPRKTSRPPQVKQAWEQTGPPPHTATKAHRGGESFIETKVPMPIPGMLRERIREGVKKELRKEAVHTASLPDDSGKVNVEKLWELVEGRKPKTMQPQNAPKFPRSSRTGFGKKRYREADTGYPVLVMENGHLIDGRHRVAKLLAENKPIPYIRVTDRDIEKARIKTAASNLFDNIRQKRARGGKPAKPGDKSYPDEKTWKKVTKTAQVSLTSKHKNPKGGLTAAGRKAYNQATGSNLKPGVRGKANTPEKLRRKGSFLSRMFGPGAKGPMQKPDGKPTRRALSAAAWGEPVPKNDQDRERLYAKGQSLLKQYKQTKTASPKIQCRVCNWSWEADESSAKDMFNCHKCGGTKTGAMIK